MPKNCSNSPGTINTDFPLLPYNGQQKKVRKTCDWTAGTGRTGGAYRACAYHQGRGLLLRHHCHPQRRASHHMNNPAIAARLATVPTTIACDILKYHALSERVPQGLSQMTPASRFAGLVRIIEFLPGRAELRQPGPPANFAVVDNLNAGEVRVICAGGSLAGAVLGDMLATRELKRGAVAAIVDGAGRDLDGIAQSGLPVQAQSVAPMAAHTTLIPFACDRPTRFAGVTVMPGVWVLADRDCLLFTPSSWITCWPIANRPRPRPRPNSHKAFYCKALR